MKSNPEHSFCAVVDIGKSTTRLDVYSGGSKHWSARIKTPRSEGDGYSALPVEETWTWLLEALSDAAQRFKIDAIIPVTHGAAAVLTDEEGRAVCPAMDYEAEVPSAVSEAYEAERPAFSESGAPSLPMGLNLGRQLSWLEATGHFGHAHRVLLYPQYWAARLSGVLASEVSSLGCHTDLWAPDLSSFSILAKRRGWDRRFPPLRRAADGLGPIRADVAHRTGLPPTCQIYCGLHDSNAALIAMRSAISPDAVRPIFISTGTWSIVAAPGRNTFHLDPSRDMLVNVSVYGEPVPCARLMGGREIEKLCAGATLETDWGALQTAIDRGLMALPSQTQSGGPFPRMKGEVIGGGCIDTNNRSAIANLYVAMMWEVMIGLVAPTEPCAPILIEGPAATPILAGLLAALRPEAKIFFSQNDLSPSVGAASLLGITFPPATMGPIENSPLPLRGLSEYRDRWHALIERSNM